MVGTREVPRGESEVQPVGWTQERRGLLGGVELETRTRSAAWGAGLTSKWNWNCGSWVPAGHSGCGRRGDRGAVLGEGSNSQRASLPDEPSRGRRTGSVLAGRLVGWQLILGPVACR